VTDAPPRAERPARTRRPLVIAIVVAVVVAVIAVIAARALRTLPAVDEFLLRYPGTSALPDWAPVGFPAWLSWQHFLSAFLLLFILRSGLRIRSKQRPPAFWTRDPQRFPKTSGTPTRLSLHVWWHLVVDGLWVLNGVVYVVLLFASGHWVRIVPTRWDIVPNAISAGLQYVSLDWPHHDGWVNYNALQVLSYFATVFLAAPLALLTGLRLSPGWKAGWRVNRVVTERLTRRVHFGVLIYFIAFTVVHVFLVFTTGVLENLDHMYAGRDDATWIGAAVFAASAAVMVVGWFVFREPVQTRIAEKTGTVRRMPGAR
jgi:thiosulfate reductase cytochrome b subunit